MRNFTDPNEICECGCVETFTRRCTKTENGKTYVYSYLLCKRCWYDYKKKYKGRYRDTERDAAKRYRKTEKYKINIRKYWNKKDSGSVYADRIIKEISRSED